MPLNDSIFNECAKIDIFLRLFFSLICYTKCGVCTRPCTIIGQMVRLIQCGRFIAQDHQPLYLMPIELRSVQCWMPLFLRGPPQQVRPST